MSTWVAADEYKQIRSSWKGRNGERFNFGTARENLDRSHTNLKAAAAELGALRALYSSLPPGDIRLTGGKVKSTGRDGEALVEEISPLRLTIVKARAEVAHWRDYVDFNQRLAAAEPVPRRPTDPLPEQDRRLPREREIGDDDVEEAIR